MTKVPYLLIANIGTIGVVLAKKRMGTPGLQQMSHSNPTHTVSAAQGTPSLIIKTTNYCSVKHT